MKPQDKPLLFCCAAFLGSSVLCFLLPSFRLLFLAVAAIAAAFCFLSAFVPKKRPRRRVTGVILLFCVLAAAVSHLYFDRFLGRADAWTDGEAHTVTATVTKIRRTASYGGSYTVLAENIDGQDCRFSLLLETEGTSLRQRERVTLPLSILPLRDSVNGYSEKAEAWEEGLCARAEQAEGEVVRHGIGAPTLSDRIVSLRQAIGERFCRLLGKRGASLYCALFEGDRSFLSDEDDLSVRRSGVSHLLAVSGMHFSLMMGAIAFLLRLFPLGGSKQAGILLVLTALYAAFTGFSPSVIRSAVMLAIAYLGYLLKLEKDPMTSLGLSAFLLLLFSPGLLLNAGFWLTVAATFGILAASPALVSLYIRRSGILREKRMKRHRGTLTRKFRIRAFLLSSALSLLCALSVSFAAQTATLPILYLFFGSVSLTSIPCGLILTPLVSLCLLLSPFLLLFGVLPPVAWFANALTSLFFAVTDFFSDLPYATLRLDKQSAGWCLLVGAVIVLILLLTGKNRRLLALPAALTIAAVLLCSVFSLYTARRNADAVYSVHAGGDSLGICTNEGAVLLDMGTGSRSAVHAAADTLSLLPEEEIAAYIVTHIGKNHRDSLAWLCRNEKVRTVYLPALVSPDEAICRHTEEEVRRTGADVRFFHLEEPFTVAGLTVTVDSVTYLDRSVLPIYRVTVETDGSRTVWLSSAFAEAGIGADGDRILRGTYGPKERKEPPSHSFLTASVGAPVRFSLSPSPPATPTHHKA